MSLEENKLAVQRLADEAFNRLNLAAVDEFVSPDLIDHNPAPGQLPGPTGVKWFVTMFHEAFPDVHFVNEHVFGEGDLIADHWCMEGTHRAPFMGIPPTGKRVSLSGIEVFRMAHGQIVERWAEIDTLGLMQQLGALPAPGGPTPSA